MFKKLSVLLLALSLSVLAFGRGGSYSGGGRSFSSGSHSSGSSSRSYSSSSSGKSYSSGSKSSPSSSGSSSSVSKSSSSSKGFSFFGKAEKAQAKANSKETFAKYKSTQQNRPDSWRPAGYDYLKSQPKETYATRTTRQQTVFKTYYVSQPQPQVVYHDTWNPYFWMWMMDHRDRQAEWVYNHRSEISDERYKELTAKNKDLEAQVKALEDKKVAKDPNYAPKEIDKDLMYSDDYVKDVQEQADEPKDDASDFNWFLWLLVFPASLALGGWAIYAVFFKKREF